MQLTQGTQLPSHTPNPLSVRPRLRDRRAREENAWVAPCREPAGMGTAAARWSGSPLLALLGGLRHPLIQAPMNNLSTPGLAAAVSRAGALGSHALASAEPERVVEDLRAAKRLAGGRPVAANLFVLPRTAAPAAGTAEAALAAMAPWRGEAGLPPSAPLPARYAPDFEEQFAAVLEEGVPVFSFTFDSLTGEKVEALKRRGTVVVGTATNVAEAVRLEAEGCDAVVAQGAEAGGHRGTFLGDPLRSLVGTLALVPQVVDAVKVPVVAAGGVMDGRGAAAAVALGAAGAQMGTLFISAAEAGRPDLAALMRAARETDTVLTTAFSGRHARGLRNRFIDGMEADPGRMASILPYPVQNALTGDLRAAGRERGDPGLCSNWCGQGAPLSPPGVRPAAELVEGVARQAQAILGVGRS